jgi:hypothetical protein
LDVNKHKPTFFDDGPLDWWLWVNGVSTVWTCELSILKGCNVLKRILWSDK